MLRTVILSLGVTLVVAASIIVIAERVSPSALPAQREALAAMQAKIDKLESILTARGTGSAERVGPGLERDADRLSELKGLVQEVQGQLLDLSREQTRNLDRVYAQLLERIDAIESTGSAAAGGDPVAKEQLLARLKELGIAVDLEGKQITLKGTIGQPTRELELILSAPGGRLHETLIVVDVLPSALKIAIELLEVPVVELDPREGWPKDPVGVYVYVGWEGLKKPRRIEDLIWNQEKRDTMTRTPFCFTASYMETDRRTWERFFVADVHRHLLALTWNYAAPAVLACPLPEAANEMIWTINERFNPPAGTAVTVTIRATPEEEWDRLP